MIGSSKKEMTMKVFQKGQVVIPVALRRKYNIEIGDHINIVSTSDGILLKPEEKKGDKKNRAIDLFGIFHKHAEKKSHISRKKINRLTEASFSNEWRK